MDLQRYKRIDAEVKAIKVTEDLIRGMIAQSKKVDKKVLKAVAVGHLVPEWTENRKSVVLKVKIESSDAVANKPLAIGDYIYEIRYGHWGGMPKSLFESTFQKD